MERKLTDKDDLIVQCSQYYANNRKELKKLQEFHIKYSQEKVFEWYTKDSCIYRLLNKALRTQNIDLIFLYRFFLQDLQSQLTRYQEQSPIRVYRGQLVSKEEWNELSNAVGQYISMNSFLSTSMQQNVAEFYTPINDPIATDALDKVPVIFQIEANPHLPGGIKPFANIQNYSEFPEENEVLFMAGSIFRIIEINNENSSRIVKMELCSNEENDLKALFEWLRREYDGVLAGYENGATLNSFGAALFGIDKYDMADKFFRRIYYEALFYDPDRIQYCLNIGLVALQSGRYKECGRWYDRASELCDVHGLIDHSVVGNLHLFRGKLYTVLNKRQQALESYNKALAIYQANYGENHSSVAVCYHWIADNFERHKYYSRSLEMRQKALQIAERTLPPMYPGLAIYHLALSRLLINLRHRDLEMAVHHAKASLEIANRVFPSDHPQLLYTYLMISEIYGLIKDFQQSRFWFNKAEVFDDIQSIDIRTQKVFERRKTYLCNQCHRIVWIYRCFEWMENTRLNCFIFHVIPFFFLDCKRYYFNY